MDSSKEPTAVRSSPTDGGGGDCNGNGASGGFVRTVDIGPSDVLLGRGRAINENLGNAAFRGLVAARKADYIGAKRKEKSRIAAEIVNRIRYRTDPPGRFLTMATDKSAAEAMGLPADDTEVWSIVDDGTAIEKTKQTLRQQKKWGGAEQQQRNRPPAAGRDVESSSAASERESRGGISGKHGTVRAVDSVAAGVVSSVQAGGVSSATPAAGILIDQLQRPMGTSVISFANTAVGGAAGVPKVAPTADETSGHVQAQGRGHSFATPSARPTNVKQAIAGSGAAKQTGSDIEKGTEDNNSLDKSRASLLESVRNASELVRKIREGHDAGVAAYRRKVGVHGSNLSGGRIRRDLVSLGCDLYRRFAGVDPFDEGRDGTYNKVEGGRNDLRKEPSISEETQVKKKERRPIPRKYVLLRDVGLPVSLCTLVSCLLDAEDEGATDRYNTVEEVEEDLCLMVADPERHLFDAGADSLRGQLVFPDDRLYGREHHISSMMQVFDRVTGSTNGPREMMLISGYSGTGKSALVEQLRGPLLRRNGYFISGKFEQLGHAQPMSVIFDAFDDFCNDIAEGNAISLAQVRKGIQDTLGSNWNVLTDLIPNLIKVVGEPATEAVHVGGREALNRFLFYFRQFVGAISSPSHPVILFLDDLQWADTASLELIFAIISDRETTSLLFIGCYRDSEVGIDHPLTSELGQLALTGDVSTSNIKLENIDRQSVNTLVSDALHLSPRLSLSLGDIVYNKTSGSPLFVVQLLRTLCDDNLLQYSASSRRWEWDVEAIQPKNVADNVVDLMTRKILKLDSEVQWLLKMAACLGSRCEPSTLKLLRSDVTTEEWDIVFLLEVAVREGLMCKLGSVYNFSHDQIQLAAYSHIAVSEREALHLHIGRVLWKGTSKEELDRLTFVVVDQLQRGSSLISDHDEKVEVARLCLTAGVKAISASAFSQALIYLLQGSVFLQESDWKNHYDLCLRLFSCCAEAQNAIGNHDGLAIAVTPIFTHGKCLQDKLWAISNHLKSMGGQGKHLDAIDFGLNILAQLGEPFPSEVHEEDFLLDFSKTREMCEGTTNDGILKEEKMQDPNKVAAMKILLVLAVYAVQVNQYLCSLMMNRMVQLTLTHGICQESPYAFASLGMVFLSFGELEQGCKYGKLALSLLDTLKSKQHLSLVFGVVYSMIIMFSEPIQSTLPPLIHGYETGISTGDIQYGLVCAHAYNMKCVLSGRKLEPLTKEVKKYVQQMKDYKQGIVLLSLPLLQAILNLTGDTEDPTKLTGEAMDQDEFLKSALEKQRVTVVNVLYFVRLWLAYLFRRYDLAAEMAQHHLKNTRTEPLRLANSVDQAFYTGLVAIEKARCGEVVEWRSVAFESLEQMKVWADKSAWNFQHKLCLLKAEMAYLNCDRDEAAEAYDDAIRAAGKHGFVHEQALACERAGLFYSVVSTSAATEYFKKAHTYYLEWGAMRKARDLFDEHLAK